MHFLSDVKLLLLRLNLCFASFPMLYSFNRCKRGSLSPFEEVPSMILWLRCVQHDSCKLNYTYKSHRKHSSSFGKSSCGSHKAPCFGSRTHQTFVSFFVAPSVVRISSMTGIKLPKAALFFSSRGKKVSHENSHRGILRIRHIT
jgi:hypothetical protein